MNSRGRFPNEIMTLLSKVSLEADGGTNGVNRECYLLRRSCLSKARNVGKIVFSGDHWRKLLETEPARIYVGSVSQWAVAPMLA